MNKRISLNDAVSMVKDGMTVMVGGFLGCGGPLRIMEALAESGVKNLTVIANDTAFPDRSLGLLVVKGAVSKLIVSHVGTNPVTGEKMNSGEIDVEFSPQGTLIERIRAKGAGLGGVLTPTGLGTIIAEGKEVINIDGKDYLLERPLGADVAILGASVADESGNLVHHGTTQNFNPLIAMAAERVIVEADKVVPVGSIAPEAVHTPAIFVDHIYVK
jgi:acetate CoA/acetoacetate CoA-transferase alpha subunit